MAASEAHCARFCTGEQTACSQTIHGGHQQHQPHHRLTTWHGPHIAGDVLTTDGLRTVAVAIGATAALA